MPDSFPKLQSLKRLAKWQEVLKPIDKSARKCDIVPQETALNLLSVNGRTEYLYFLRLICHRYHYTNCHLSFLLSQKW